MYWYTQQTILVERRVTDSSAADQYPPKLLAVFSVRMITGSSPAKGNESKQALLASQGSYPYLSKHFPIKNPVKVVSL